LRALTTRRRLFNVGYDVQTLIMHYAKTRP